MLTKLMKKSISAFERYFKDCWVEIRNVYTLDYIERNKQARFKIEFNKMAINKYFYVIVTVDDNSKEIYIYDTVAC